MNKSIISNVDELLHLITNGFESFATILDQIVGQIVKNPQHISAFISHINVQLSNSPTRRKGLELLSTFLPFCPYELCMEHAIAWINNSLKYCENEREVNNTAFKVIKSLLKVCNNTPELNKIVVSTIIEKLIDEIRAIECKSPNSIIALDCLYNCLNIYPGACGSRKNNLYKYLITYLDCPIPSANVRVAAKCFNALQQVGGGGTDGINYYQNWKLQQQRLCATLHKLMDQFFETVTEFGDFQEELKDIIPLELSDLPECKTFQSIAYRMINTSIFLQEMLLEKYPVRKSVLPVVILNVISRGLAISSSTLGVHIVEDMINLSSYLSLIHKHLLKLLQCLITSLGTNLIPWGTIICKLIINNLKGIQSSEVFTVETLCDIRITTYETLRLWITTAKAASGIDILMDSLFPIIVNDITPIKNEINLTVQGNISKNLSKKARRKIIEDSARIFAAKNNLINKNVDNHSQFQQKICITALQTFQTIIHYGSSHIKPILHKQMQEFIIKNLYNVQRGNIEHPYNIVNCQIELYKSLIKVTMSHHYNINPPIHYAINLLSVGQTNNNTEISNICSNGLMVLNTVIHPYCATLQLPLDIDNVKADLKNNGTVSNHDDSIENIHEDNMETVVEIPDNTIGIEVCYNNNIDTNTITNTTNNVNTNDNDECNAEKNSLLKTDTDERDSDELVIISDSNPSEEFCDKNSDNETKEVYETSVLEKMDVIQVETNNQNKEINSEENCTVKNLIKNVDEVSDDEPIPLDEELIFNSFNDIVN